MQKSRKSAAKQKQKNAKYRHMIRNLSANLERSKSDASAKNEGINALTKTNAALISKSHASEGSQPTKDAEADILRENFEEAEVVTRMLLGEIDQREDQIEALGWRFGSQKDLDMLDATKVQELSVFQTEYDKLLAECDAITADRDQVMKDVGAFVESHSALKTQLAETEKLLQEARAQVQALQAQSMKSGRASTTSSSHDDEPEINAHGSTDGPQAEVNGDETDHDPSQDGPEEASSGSPDHSTGHKNTESIAGSEQEEPSPTMVVAEPGQAGSPHVAAVNDEIDEGQANLQDEEEGDRFLGRSESDAEGETPSDEHIGECGVLHYQSLC